MKERKIKIGWKEYKIMKARQVLNSGTELMGQIDYNAQTITLRDANSPEQDKATLLHEVLHGIDEMYALGLDESTIERLTNAIYTFFKDNEMLMTNAHDFNFMGDVE